MRFGHIALSVSNLKKSIAFYRRLFSLKCIQKYQHQDSGLAIALLKKGDIELELFEFKRHKPLPKYRKTLDNDLATLGVKHFSVEVSDIEGVYRKFKKAQVAFATGMRVFDNGRQYFFIKDPDGILVEVMEANR
jgi:catechol 2,3-dioxygenase-like lactoylglutathione lyase family enzyme